MNRHDLKKIALMGLAAGLTILNSASAEETPKNPQDPAKGRPATESTQNRLQGWKPHIDSPIPGYTKARELAENEETQKKPNGNGNNGNGNGNNGNKANGQSHRMNGNSHSASCKGKGGCAGM